MTVTAEQIAIAKASGWENIEHVATACNKTGCYFYLALAALEKESGGRKGRNVYGSDSGGALEDFPKEVNKGNFEVFEWMVFTKGQTSNGVGPLQLTFKGFFTELKKEKLEAWNPEDTIYFGVRLLWGYFKTARRTKGVRDAIRWAGTWYNAGPDERQIIGYGNHMLEVALKWKERVGNDDYA